MLAMHEPAASEQTPPDAPSSAKARIFRREALDGYQDGVEGYSEVIWAPRAWLKWIFSLLVGVAVLGVGFLTWAQLDEYAQGPCVVRVAGDLTQVRMALPGAERSQLRVGARVRVELAGRPKTHRWVRLTSVADRLVGATEARRWLGVEGSTALPADDSLSLAEGTFEEAGSVSYDGTRGVAYALVGRKSVVNLLASRRDSRGR
jgi:hypothetical protein